MEASSVAQVVASAEPTPSALRTRLFSRHLFNAALLLLLPMLLSPTLNAAKTLLVDPDIWWHLANARILAATHHFIWTDPYAFTAAGQRWIDWEWLSELPYLFFYNVLGLRGIYLVTWFTLSGNLLLVYWRGCRRSGSGNAALWASAVALVLMTVNAGPRMIEFAYMAMSVELAILKAAERGDKRWLWCLPPLFCLWINLHGTWLIGIGLLGLYILCGLFPLHWRFFEQRAFTAKERNRLLAVFVACLAAVFVNPYGWHLVWSPFDMMLNQKMVVAVTTEWQPLSLSSFEGKGVVVAIALMVIANWRRSRKWTMYELAIILFAWYAAIDHHRFTYLAAVLTTPMLAVDLRRAFFTESDAETIPAANYTLTAAALCAMLVLFPSEGSLKKMQQMMFPLRLVAAIQPSWRTFNAEYVGGMMAFESKPSFMDTRYDSFEHNNVMTDYRKVWLTRDALSVLDKYRVDHALVKGNMPIAGLLERTAGWRVLMREKSWGGEYILFARDPAAIR